MAETTGIEWAHCTGGPWLGCTKVSPGCGNCYACDLANTRLERIFRRAYEAARLPNWSTRPIWGDTAPRVRTKGFWTDARRFNAKAKREGTRLRMFPSLIDWLDEMPAGILDQDGTFLNGTKVLADFLQLIHDTPNLDWLLLTKRPENWRERLHLIALGLPWQGVPMDAWEKGFEVRELARKWTEAGTPPANLWIGTTVEDQTRADQRIPALLQIPARIRFLSCEPLLGPVDLYSALKTCWRIPGSVRDWWHAVETGQCEWHLQSLLPVGWKPGVHWLIAGGESGPGARPMHDNWARALRDQCAAANVPFFMKQMGGPRDKRGRLEQLPEDLRLRQFPHPAAA